MTPRRPAFTLLLTGLALAALVGMVGADSVRDHAKSELEFGIKVAQRGLWNEAIYRWERAVELDADYAAAHNNLAIGYEHEGKFDKAQVEYEKALKLDPENEYIKQNYDLFKEINDKTKRRGDRK